MMVQSQDMTALTAAFYVDCSLDKLFNQLVHLASEEGVTEISGRVAGSYFFEINAAQKAWQNPEDYTTKERGRIFGTALSVILNYTLWMKHQWINDDQSTSLKKMMDQGK